MTATKQQPIAGYRISDPSDPTIKPWLSDTPDDNGYTSEPLYAGAAPAAVAPQGEYPHLPQSVGDVTDFGDGKVDIDWGHPAPVGGTRLYSADQMRAYVDADRVARAGQPAAVTGPALALVERQALEALCAVAVAAFHAADDSSDNGNIIEVQRADFEALDAALDLLDELPDDQPGYTMTPGAKAKWALRRLLEAAPALEAHAAPAVEGLRALMSLVRREAPHLSGKVMGDADAILAGAALAAAPQAPAQEAPAAPAPAVPDDWRLVPANPTDAMLGAAQKAWLADPLRRSSTLYAAALAAAPQAPAAPSPYSADLLAALGQWHQRCEVMGAHHTLTEAQIAELVVAGLLRRAHGGQVITTAGRAALAAPAAPAVDAQKERDAAFEAVRQRLCRIPRWSFHIDSRGNLRRVDDARGNWIEFSAAHELFDPVVVDAAIAAQAAAKGAGDA